MSEDKFTPGSKEYRASIHCNSPTTTVCPYLYLEQDCIDCQFNRQAPDLKRENEELKDKYLVVLKQLESHGISFLEMGQECDEKLEEKEKENKRLREAMEEALSYTDKYTTTGFHAHKILKQALETK